MFLLSILSNDSSRFLSKSIPIASKRSALPTLLETDLFPCLATLTFNAERIKDEIVETLIMDFESPPVPHKSIRRKSDSLVSMESNKN